MRVLTHRLPSLSELLASRLMRNFGSLGGAQVAIRVSRLATTILLARLLAPLDYGLAAIVLTIYELVALFTRNGISAKVVQADAADVAVTAQTAYRMTLIVCCALLVLQTLIALPIAWLYHDTRLAMPIALMGLIYLATPLCNIQAAFQQRENRLGRIALTGSVQIITDNFLTVALASLGLGMWAIILPKLLVAPIWVIGVRYGHSWRPSSSWSMTGWRDIAQFSRSVVGVELLTTLQANIDNFIVGWLLGVEALGLYYFAYNAGLGITLGLVNAMGIALYPHFCEARGEPALLAQRYRRSLQLLGCLLVPPVLLQAALAPVYVPIVFGTKWSAAVPVLMLICLSALPRPFAVACSQLLKAVGRPDIELRWQSVMTVLLVVGLICGAGFGLVGVAAALLLVQGSLLTAYALLAPRTVLGAGEAARFSFEVVTTPERLAALEAEWDALWQRAESPLLTQSFAWSLSGWQTTARVRGRRLHIVVMREAGRAVLIWPLALRRHGFCRVAAPLGAEGTEYDSLLVEQGAGAEERVQAALAFARRRCRLDVIRVPFARSGTPMQAALAARSAAIVQETLAAPYTCFAAYESWDAYWRSRSRNLRTGLLRRRRRLAAIGTVTTDWVTDPDEFAAMLDWTLRQKLGWMARTGLRNESLIAPEYRAFLLQLMQRPAPSGRVAMLVLRLDGQPIASKLGCIDGTRFEGFITTYDPAYADYSPGQLLLLDTMQWCQTHGLQYDFRIGKEAYKQHWANGDCRATTFGIATTVRGMVLLRGEVLLSRSAAARERLRTNIPEAWRSKLKSFVPLRGFTGYAIQGVTQNV